MGTRKKPPVVIDLRDYRVVEDEGPQPIIKSWAGLAVFVGLFAIAVAVRYCQIVTG